MRHGADVYVAVTRSTEKMVGADLLEWATGNPVVRELTGKLEHIQLAGKHSDHADLVLVAPATANTIGKIAAGIDDTPVTTIAATAIGSKIPLIIVPAMHEPMYDHPIVQDNISQLQKIGVGFVDPEISEGKAKIASTEQIVRKVISRLSNTPVKSPSTNNDLRGRRVLVTAGPTVEHIDPVRVITNKSSGKMGIAIAEEAASRGAETTLILGPTNISPPSNLNTIRIENTKEMLDVAVRELKSSKYDLVFAAAAPSDYRPSTSYPDKIKTRKNPTVKLELQTTPKIIEQMRSVSPSSFLVAFKTDQNLSKDDLVNEAFEIIHENNADLVAANDVGQEGRGFQSDTNELYVVDNRKTVVHIPLADKRQVARGLVDLAVSRLMKK